jgi:hypothetical protein
MIETCAVDVQFELWLGKGKPCPRSHPTRMWDTLKLIMGHTLGEVPLGQTRRSDEMAPLPCVSHVFFERSVDAAGRSLEYTLAT